MGRRTQVFLPRNAAVSRLHALVLLAMLSVLAACAGGTQVWDYSASGQRNAVTKAKAHDKRWFLSRDANIAIHYEVAPCKFEYAGTIVVGEAPQSFALPKGQRVMVQFNFIMRDAFFQGSAHDSFNQVLKISPSATYDFELFYGKEGIDYSVMENRSGSRQPAMLVPFQNCT